MSRTLLALLAFLAAAAQKHDLGRALRAATAAERDLDRKQHVVKRGHGN